jgi:hypothetical protein
MPNAMKRKPKNNIALPMHRKTGSFARDFSKTSN